MPFVFVKRVHEPDRTRVEVEKVEELPVKDLRATIGEKLEIPLEELHLSYGGRVLKAGKTLGHYEVTEGCTIHVITKKKIVEEPPPEPLTSGFGSLVMNRRTLGVIGRMYSNPTFIQAMIAGTPLANNPAIRTALSNPQVLSELADPDAIAEHLRNNPEAAILTEIILRLYTTMVGRHRGVNPDDDEDMVDMVEGNLEEDMERARDEEQYEQSLGRLASQQEQMFEHSQALRAHQQQVRHETERQALEALAHVEAEIRARRQQRDQQRDQQQQQASASAPETSYQPAASLQHGTLESASGGGGAGAITQQQLASALVGAMGGAQDSSQPSPLSSLDFSSIPSSGPASLSADFSSVPTTSAMQTEPSSGGGGGAVGLSEQAGTVTREHVPGGQDHAITPDALQQALTSAMGSVTPPSTTTPQVPPRAQPRSIRDRYRAQLEQLHAMGITDDAAALHALEATSGDLESALEILMGQ